MSKFNFHFPSAYYKDTKNNKYSPFAQLIKNHGSAFLFALGEIVKNPFSSFLTLSVIGIVMALPFGFYLLLSNFQSISQNWESKPTISLYLKKGISSEEINQAIEQLTKRKNVESVSYISPEEGLIEFQKLTQLKSVLTHLSENPLPGVINVVLKQKNLSPGKLEKMGDSLLLSSWVENIEIDSEWIKRLFYLVQIGQRIFYTLTFIFSIGVMLIVGNTIRLILQDHHQEILVLRLIGATKIFIRRPFLYRGFLYGALGGMLAWCLVSLVLLWLATPLQALSESYGTLLYLKGLDSILGVSGMLGLLGSWIALYEPLQREEET